MKSALETDESYAEYRLSLVSQVTNAAERFNVPIKDRVVLDLGCFDGAISLGYLDYGAKHVIGIDIDSDAIAVAKEQRSSSQVEFHESNTDGIPLDDNSIDTILCFDVFEHVSEPAPMLEEINRILKPGGQILIGTWGWKHPFAPHLWSTMPVPYAGKLKVGKYDYEVIPEDYLNKYLIKDFEAVFKKSSLDYEMHPQPFGSRFASWTKYFLNIPWINEFITGYLWVVLTKPASEPEIKS